MTPDAVTSPTGQMFATFPSALFQAGGAVLPCVRYVWLSTPFEIAHSLKASVQTRPPLCWLREPACE